MEMPKNYEETVGVTGDFEGLQAGGYICKVISAKEENSQNGNRMLVVAFDIAEGEHKDFYKRRYEANVKGNKDPNYKVKWPNNGVHRIMVEDKDGNCNKFFKGFITIMEESNEFDFKKAKYDETKLKDKLFGGIFGEEEYEKMDGTIGKTVKLRFVRNIGIIEDGKYEIPEIKKLPTSNNNIFNEFNVTANDDDDLPF